MAQDVSRGRASLAMLSLDIPPAKVPWGSIGDAILHAGWRDTPAGAMLPIRLCVTKPCALNPVPMVLRASHWTHKDMEMAVLLCWHALSSQPPLCRSAT